MTEPRINGTAVGKIKWLSDNTVARRDICQDGTLDIWVAGYSHLDGVKVVLSPDGSWWIEE